ncbi:MAG: polyprenyl synthetase family protein [Armatimonadota bacterium]
MDVKQALEDTKQSVDEALECCLPQVGEVPTQLAAAMRHAVGGGKRVRPFLVLHAARAFGLPAESVLPLACGIEMMHCATLVHDDLPCIDNADLRHGRPSCHLAFDEATAVLAADALIILGFECGARQTEVPGISPQDVVQCLREFAEYTGPRGLIVGEALDIETENRPYTEAELEFIHLNKTAKLIIFSARAGAILAGAPAEQLAILTEYAEALGLLFQITDDLLDVTSTEAEMGKPVGADAEAGKATYPDLLGFEAALRRAEEVAERAMVAARQLPEADVWVSLAEFIVARRK